MDDFEGRSSLHHWLYCIANNKYKDYLRRKKLITFVPFVSSSSQEKDGEDFNYWGITEGSLVDYSDGPQEKLEKLELRKAVVQAITTLRPHHKEVIRMLYYEGLEVEEISNKLKIPVGTVKSRLFRARENIERKLKPFMIKKARKKKVLAP